MKIKTQFYAQTYFGNNQAWTQTILGKSYTVEIYKICSFWSLYCPLSSHCQVLHETLMVVVKDCVSTVT